MRIYNEGNILSVSNQEKAGISYKASESTCEKSDISVKVSISEEGINRYRDSLREENEGYDFILGQRNELQAEKMMTDFGIELGNKFSSLRKEGTYQSTEELAADLLRAYADMYNEIVQGYESGTRETYVKDKMSESGYRKLTMSEEIDFLNATYNKSVDFLETQAQLKPQIADALKKYIDTLSRIAAKSEKAAEVAAKAQDEYLKLKEEIVPKNIKEKMVKATKAIDEQYMKLNTIDIESILAGIIMKKEH